MSARENRLLDEGSSPQRLAGLSEHSAVLLALSGGADSCALLHALKQLSEERNFRLCLAHVNHGIRGAEAERDELFCRQLADRYHLECFVLHADVPDLAQKSGKGIEEVAREVRYTYFAQLMQRENIPILVTAHHADDALETVLFHLARGSGRRGIGGISPVRAFSNGFLVRPFLPIPKAELLSYCEKHGLQFVTDSTNGDISYARNRIRKEVVPVLEDLFGSPQTKAAALCADLREEEEFLNAFSEERLRALKHADGLSLTDLQALPVPVRKRCLRLWLEENGISGIDRVQLQRFEDAFRSRKRPCKIPLQGECFAVLERDRLALRKKDEPSIAEPIRIPFTVGITEFPTLGIRIEIEKVNNLSTASTINSNEISVIMNNTLYFRTKQTGDTVLIGGMHRKLRKLYNAAKVPPSIRNALPLLCDAEGIVWAPLIGTRDRLPTNGTAVRIRILSDALSCIFTDEFEKGL